jgi:NitT/TauT family transport system ATP-binding protein
LNKNKVNLSDVSKVYKRGGEYEIILRNCSFEIKPEKLTVLLGPSGCGKSTIINLIAGYENPTMGEVSIGEDRITGPGPDRAVVFQETALFPWMTLKDNIIFGPLQQGVARVDADKKAEELLSRVGLVGFGDKYPDQVSGGMQRRAEVARAFINDPKVMLLDEPFRGLDHMTRGLMQEYYSALFEEMHMTTLFVTSEVDEAIFLADEIVVLSYKPTAVKAIIEVDLPRPRDFTMLTSPRYGELKNKIIGLLYEEALKGFSAGVSESSEMKDLIEVSLS